MKKCIYAKRMCEMWDPFYEALFFVGAITFLQIYMILLIKDLDNPFEYYGGDRGPDEISLKPLEDLKIRIEEKIGSMPD